MSLSDPSDIEAVKINQILKSKYYDSDGETWWWTTANTHLKGKTPREVWLSENELSVATIEMVRIAAVAANIMGHAV
jgi:hypothetical protein